MPTADQYKKVKVYAKRFADAIEELGDESDPAAVAWVRQWQQFAADQEREIEAAYQRELEF